MNWAQVITIIGSNVVMALCMVGLTIQSRREFRKILREIQDDISISRTRFERKK